MTSKASAKSKPSADTPAGTIAVIDSPAEVQSQGDLAFGTVTFTYVNASHVGASNMDVRIAFSERINKQRFEPRLGIVMSHAHAKALLVALKTTLDAIDRTLSR